MKELLSMGLLWFFVLAELFTFYMQRTASEWGGANQVIPEVMKLVFVLCQTAILVLVVIIFIKVRPWWYGLVMLAAGYILPQLLPPSKTLEIIIAELGMIAGPVFIVLSYLKVFAVI